MSCFCCCKTDPATPSSKKSTHKNFQSHKDFQFSGGRNTFKSFVANLSLKTGSSRQRQIAEEIKKHGTAKNDLKPFTYQQIADATDNFNPDDVIGEGGYGKVYKGHLKSINKDVAVKQLDRNGRQGTREFFSEVLMLSLVKHPNLVQLIGYCAEGDHRILVYEFMSNGTVEDHLLELAANKEPLDWKTRMKIALGAARGLEYLHDTSEPPMIYRDFKTSNILLDDDFNPKLSDFGLAKLGPTGGKEHVSTRVMGTYGYCAPEYASTGQLTRKSDVYSYGVVFLEIISGRRVFDKSRTTEEQNLIDWAQPLFEDRKKFTLMADPLLKDNFPVKGLFKALAVAAMCLQQEAETRPLMADVVTALEHLVKTKDEENNNTDETIVSAGHVESVRIRGDREL
ncbi:hypothetical protein L6164_035872 [Bauhinia variegata]|uniref:Uncharacterized protein n=1 Tax=Bauhinia variegata TaxID=167791 RepID=A0ACB9KFC3_BAUVA|nr:hypothetical protein L6164_035872 [Bauhinia variegata]